jgi:hypothetical protein
MSTRVLAAAAGLLAPAKYFNKLWGINTAYFLVPAGVVCLHCGRFPQIKPSAPFVISPLTHICNAILDTGVFPDRLKFAIVKACFKKENTQEISNYRPISLLTSF